MRKFRGKPPNRRSAVSVCCHIQSPSAAGEETRSTPGGQQRSPSVTSPMERYARCPTLWRLMSVRLARRDTDTQDVNCAEVVPLWCPVLQGLYRRNSLNRASSRERFCLGQRKVLPRARSVAQLVVIGRAGAFRSRPRACRRSYLDVKSSRRFVICESRGISEVGPRRGQLIDELLWRCAGHATHLPFDGFASGDRHFVCPSHSTRRASADPNRSMPKSKARQILEMIHWRVALKARADVPSVPGALLLGNGARDELIALG
jgi:hypothetical protein